MTDSVKGFRLHFINILFCTIEPLSHRGYTNLEVLRPRNLTIMTKCVYVKSFYSEGYTGLGWIQVVLVISSWLALSQTQHIWMQGCNWASLLDKFDDICPVPLPFPLSIQFYSVQCCDCTIAWATPNYLLPCYNEHNFVFFFCFAFPFCHSILCPPSVPSCKCIMVFSLNFFFPFSWNAAPQQSVEC